MFSTLTDFESIEVSLVVADEISHRSFATMISLDGESCACIEFAVP